MQWHIVNKHNHDDEVVALLFDDADAATRHLAAMGPSFQSVFEVAPITNDPNVYRMLTEGLVQGDLRRIILPQISIDEYVPGDPNTDNVVIALFIKGVPEAIIPIRDFVMNCKGVLDVAYGSSDTIPDASIIYAEMARGDLQLEDIKLMVEQIAMLADLEPADFSLVFPTSTRRYPYSLHVMRDYFVSRDEKQNKRAQQDAMDKVDDDKQSTSDEMSPTEITPQEQTEAMIESLIESIV